MKKKSVSQLHKLLSEERGKVRDLRFKDANKQLKDVRALRKAKLTIARILTLLNISKSQEPGAVVSAEEAKTEINDKPSGQDDNKEKK